MLHARTRSCERISYRFRLATRAAYHNFAALEALRPDSSIAEEQLPTPGIHRTRSDRIRVRDGRSREVRECPRRPNLGDVRITVAFEQEELHHLPSQRVIQILQGHNSRRIGSRRMHRQIALAAMVYRRGASADAAAGDELQRMRHEPRRAHVPCQRATSRATTMKTKLSAQTSVKLDARRVDVARLPANPHVALQQRMARKPE